jgi:signal transduction histidine kinase
LVGAIDGIDAAIRQLREAIFGLHAVPQEVDVAEAVTELADEKTETLGFRPMVHVGTMPDDLSSTLSHEALQVVGEALSNIARHANASAAKIEVEAVRGWLALTISDNGRGIAGSYDGPQDGLAGEGLSNMEERAKDLGGRFHVGPGAGGGTRIDWAAPLTAALP